MKKDDSKVLTDSRRQTEIAVSAVYLLGGARRSIDTEDVAVKCHEIAPALFSWQKRKDQINLEVVRKSLSDAKRRGSLVTGSGRDGWRLSNRGIDWARSQEKAGNKLGSPASSDLRSHAGSIDSVRRERERLRLLSTEAWRIWKDSQSISTEAAQRLFRIDETTTAQMAAIKVGRLRAIFDADEELGRFIADASKTVLHPGGDK